MIHDLIIVLAGEPTPPPAAPADQPAWWESVVGILGIPAAMLAIPAAWILIRKSNLEARKIQLEIAEKEAALNAATAQMPEYQASSGGLKELVTPLIESRLVQTIILRFIVLYLA